MGIPESQLQVWSRQGDVAAAEATYQSIRQAFSAATCPLRETDFELYLHGSYRNGTNIRGDSDVDIVAQLNSTFDVDDSALSASEKDLLRSSCRREPYLWDEFRADALQALEACYGTSNVWETTRSLRVAGDPGRLRADIVVCLQYRKYERFRSMRDQRYFEGITFYAFKENRWLSNFPKIHYENGVSKNSQRRTRGRYWPTVRVFKNARTYLVDHGMIPEDLAPSHMLECLLYNVPDNRFAPTHQMTFLDVIAWLLGSFRDDQHWRFTCQHEQLPLFGDRPDQWVPDRAIALLENLIELWKDW